MAGNLNKSQQSDDGPRLFPAEMNRGKRIGVTFLYTTTGLSIGLGLLCVVGHQSLVALLTTPDLGILLLFMTVVFFFGGMSLAFRESMPVQFGVFGARQNLRLPQLLVLFPLIMVLIYFVNQEMSYRRYSPEPDASLSAEENARIKDQWRQERDRKRGAVAVIALILVAVKLGDEFYQKKRKN